MKRWILVLLLTPSFCQAVVNLSTTWSEPGDFKMSAGDTAPYVAGVLCSSCEINPIWDGKSINLFAAKGELVTWVTYLICGNTTCTNVNVSISSFTGTGAAAGTGFAAVTRSSGSVWDYSQAPYSLYKYAYLQTVGKHEEDTYWDNSEYDEQQLPSRYQVPFTVNANKQGVTNPPTQWTNRHDANAYRPDPAVPMEMYSSSFTISASSSQAIGGEVYVSTGLVADATYTATVSVWEGSTLSTSVPVNLYVYNVTMPSRPTIPAYAVCGYADTDGVMYGNESPASDQVDPYLTGHVRLAAFLHRHKIACVGDPFVSGNYWPSLDYQKHEDGSAFKEAYGLAWNTSPGYGVPDKAYWANVYGSATNHTISTFTLTGSTGYCTYVSSVSTYCQNNGLSCQMYTADDEAADSILHSKDDVLASYNNTNANCIVNGSTLPYLQTGSLQVVASTAPNINTVMSTKWINASTQTYQALQNQYLAQSSHTLGGYNSTLGVDTMFSTEEDGLGPREIMWGAYKTKIPFWFSWYINYWYDVNAPGQIDNGWNAVPPGPGEFDKRNQPFVLDKNFGFDLYPATDTAKGHYGFNFTHDGMMVYPGQDVRFSTESFGLNGFIGSWVLNQYTRGIQDADLLSMANAVNPSSTTAILNAEVQDVMYLRQCFDPVNDCSYSFGTRPWDQTLWGFSAQQKALLQIIDAANNGGQNVTVQGKVQFQGRNQIQ